ncbi:hypothetical protein SLE2022_086530 [Rubroshorea leprosula]
MAVPISSFTKSPLCPRHLSQCPHLPLLRSLRPLPKGLGNATLTLTTKAHSFGFFQGGGFGSDDDPPSSSPSQTGAARAWLP